MQQMCLLKWSEWKLTNTHRHTHRGAPTPVRSKCSARAAAIGGVAGSHRLASLGHMRNTPKMAMTLIPWPAHLTHTHTHKCTSTVGTRPNPLSTTQILRKGDPELLGTAHNLGVWIAISEREIRLNVCGFIMQLYAFEFFCWQLFKSYTCLVEKWPRSNFKVP